MTTHQKPEQSVTTQKPLPMPQPKEPPGEVPDIGDEYTTFGVSKMPPEEESKQHLPK